MKISVVGGFSALWGRDMPPDILLRQTGKSVGGGEEAMIRTSVGLASYGHDVTLWWCGQSGEWRGVKFKGDFDPLSPALLRDAPDVIIGWSTILPFQWKKSLGGKVARCLFAQQLNDCWAPGDWSMVDCVVSPSRNHAAQLPRWGWKGKWTVVHNGLDPELYGAGEVGSTPPGFIQDSVGLPVRVLSWGERPFHVGYWSSPDRGLHHLLRAWPDVIVLEPKARLHIFYEIDNWLGSGAARSLGAYGDRAKVMLNELLPEAKADSTITFHGQVTRKTLAKTQLQCRVQCYPFIPIEYTEGFCHPAGTLITTLGGLKPIETLTLQDKVLGRSGRWQPITMLKTRRFIGENVRLLPACGEEIEMTPDHPVLVSRDGVEFVYCPAMEVKAGMWVFSATPHGTLNEGSIPFPLARVVTPQQQEGQRKGAQTLNGAPPIVLPPLVNLSNELCRLVGYFAGDGNAPNRGRNASTVSLFFGTEQKMAWVEDALTCFVKVFGDRACPTILDNRPAKKMLTLRLESSAIAHVFSGWCCASNGKKCLPEWVMELSTSKTTEVLKGLWRTDGSVVETDSARFASFSSSSPYLIGQVRTMLLKLGRQVRIQRRNHQSGKISWSVNFSIAGSFLDYGSIRAQEARMGHFYVIPMETGAALRVREVVPVEFSGDVYALTVAEDESYHAGNFVVHNCGSINQGIAAGCHVLGGPHDALPSLYSGAVSWLPPSPDEMERVLPGEIVRALHQPPPPGAEAARFRFTWDAASKEMERAVGGLWDSDSEGSQ